YYNKPDQEGVYAHFAAVAQSCDLPLFIYNVPSRTALDVLPETVSRLAEMPNVVGIKDASGNISRAVQARLDCGEDFCVLSGSDELNIGFMAAGARGAISVTANVAPMLCAEFMTACDENRWNDARALNERLHFLHLAMFAAPSPAPAKYALAKMGRLPHAKTRLPITGCNDAAKRRVDAALAHAGLA
ncbi:MAG: dihydrodipicolinate synthase family protein, partial [Pacificimonas sp.]